MSRPVASYVDRVLSVRADELGPGERYLAATRLSMPQAPPKAEDPAGGGKMDDLRRVFRVGMLTKGDPQRIPGFPTDWQMAVALTPQRLIVWKAMRGTDLPGLLLGAVQIHELRDVGLVTVPDRRGRTLAVKFVLRHGPRVLLDVVAGYRADSEQLVTELGLILLD